MVSHHGKIGGEGQGTERERGVGTCRERRGETKMSGLYREKPLGEGQPSPWSGKFKVGGRVCLVGTKECLENLEARSALVCKICTSVFCPGVQNQSLRYSQGVPIDVEAGIKQ